MFSPVNQQEACEEFWRRATDAANTKGTVGVSAYEIERFGVTVSHEYPNPGILALGYFAAEPSHEAVLPWASRHDADYSYIPEDPSSRPIPHQDIAEEYIEYLGTGHFNPTRIPRPRTTRRDELRTLEAISTRMWLTTNDRLSVNLPNYALQSYPLAQLQRRLAEMCRLLQSVDFYTYVASSGGIDSNGIMLRTSANGTERISPD